MKHDTLVDIKLSFVLRLHAFVNFCGKNKRQIVIITQLSFIFVYCQAVKRIVQ